MKLGTEVGLGSGHMVSVETLLPQMGTASQFLAHVCCDQTAGWNKILLATKVVVGTGDIVLDGDPAPPSRRGMPQFLAHVCCERMFGWIKMPLGTEVDLSPGLIVC